MKSQQRESEDASSRQYVALLLNGETYGIDIAHIHTVIVPQPITPVPRTPDYILGVMSLRGQIMPVMDLRTRFGMPTKTEDAETRIVILNLDGLSAGLVVDGVTEVFWLNDSQIESPSAMLSSEAATCISGIGKAQANLGGLETLVLVLDTSRLLSVTLQDSHFAESVAA